MAILDKPQLKAYIDNFVTTNGLNEITGAVLNDVMQTMTDSLANLVSDSGNLGLYQYDTQKAYGIGEITWFDGNFYISKNDQSAGVFTAANWIKLSNFTDLSSYDTTFLIYDAGTTYNDGDAVRSNNQFFVCNTNGTTGEDPETSANFDPVFVHLGDESQEWQAGYYLEDQRISFNNKRYYLTGDGSGEAINSTTDPETDPDWVQFNAGGAGGSQDLNSVLTEGNITGGQDINVSDGDKVSFLKSLAGTIQSFTILQNFASAFKIDLGNAGLLSPLYYWRIVQGGLEVGAREAYFFVFNGVKQLFEVNSDDERIITRVDSFRMLNNTTPANYSEIKTDNVTGQHVLQAPDKGGIIATTSDIITPSLVQTSGALLLTATNQLVMPLTLATEDGSYMIELEGYCEITDDATLQIEASFAPSVGQRQIQNNQGGGGARTVSFAFTSRFTGVFTAGQALNFNARIIAGAGSATLRGRSMKITKLS